MIRLIEITESDILNGEPHDCDKCAIALALRREYKTDRVDVGIDNSISKPYLYVNSKELNINSTMEGAVLDFINDFDYREENNLPDVEPFTLEVVE
jgi:hypothetical protein